MTQIVKTTDGIELSGSFTFENITKVETEALNVLQNVEKFARIRFAKVQNSDSSLLALMMVLVNYANKSNISIEFDNVPEQIKSMAELSGLSNCLNI